MTENKRKSYPPPEGDYITKDQYDEILSQEKDPMFSLLFKTMWSLGLRVSECVGQDESIIKQIEAYRAARTKEVKAWNKARAREIKRGLIEEKRLPSDKEVELIPGIRVMDIDAVKPKDFGLKCKHTLRVWRKGHKFNVLPLPDDLHKEMVAFYNPRRLQEKDRIFPVTRFAVNKRLGSYGYTVGGRKKVHPHALRRGFGVDFRAKGGQVEVLQAVYNHTALPMTLRYIGLDKTKALNEFTKFLNNAPGDTPSR